ncbi:BrnT family toxin [Pleurocapsa sp. PCC 7319]|uniref:BrnT family toxin n=1 Tax=Pleurocapsa sp. PCC 7319 TaxID=118161 RepID=UPI00034A05B1|nr:BrnT family toxin [Pleurocapsa sp. PCC 7319]
MFQWDEQKAESNQAKHIVSFPFATRAFDDENRLTIIDNRYNYGETRYITLAQIDKRVYVIVFTMRSSIIRLISARKANKKEVKRYVNR